MEVSVCSSVGVWPCPFRGFHCCPDGIAGSKGFTGWFAHIKRLDLSSDDERGALREDLSTDCELFVSVGEALKALDQWLCRVSPDRVPFSLPIMTIKSIPHSYCMAFSHALVAALGVTPFGTDTLTALLAKHPILPPPVMPGSLPSEPPLVMDVDSGSAIDVGLLKAISVVANLLLEGRCLKVLEEFMASAPLTPLFKPDNGIRHIAVCAIWRRLTSKVAMRGVRNEMSKIPWGLSFWVGRPQRDHQRLCSKARNRFLNNVSLGWDRADSDYGYALDRVRMSLPEFDLSGVSFDLSPHQKAVVECPRAPRAQNFLTVIPIEGLGQHMSALKYQTILKYRLIIPLFPVDEPCPVCRKAMGKHACVDLTGVSSLVGLMDNGFVAGQAALKAESSKVAKHEKACLENQHVFIPFAFDTFGFLAPEAEEFLNRVQRVVQSNFSTPKTKNFIFSRIGFAIQKGVAAQLVARLSAILL
ncbi:hypothetical protein Tco_0018036 [Tanacetum coccineum]